MCYFTCLFARVDINRPVLLQVWRVLVVVSATLFAASDVVGGAQEQHRRRERYTDLYLSSDVDTGGGGGVTDSNSVEGDTSEVYIYS